MFRKRNNKSDKKLILYSYLSVRQSGKHTVMVCLPDFVLDKMLCFEDCGRYWLIGSFAYKITETKENKRIDKIIFL